MARIVKEHDERRNEIIRTAAVLFSQKGYEKCSVNDILNAIGIAKGTFYYYFKSKEDVLDAAVEQISEQVLMQVQKIAAKKELSPVDRIIQVLLAVRVTGPTEEALIQEMHKSRRQKCLKRLSVRWRKCSVWRMDSSLKECASIGSFEEKIARFSSAWFYVWRR